MTTGGRFYREKFKPPTIQYIEEHFAEFFNFMENISPEYVQYVQQMTENYVNYVKEMSEKVAVYLEQTTPLAMNRERVVPAIQVDSDFIPSNSAIGVPVGLIDAEFENLSKVFLLIIGRAENMFAGYNDLNCTTATHNQWQVNIDGGAYVDLQNGAKADGQMLDTDWRCEALGVIHPFTFMFDITDQIVALDDMIGIRLANSRARQNNLIVTIDVYLKVVWKL